MTRAYLAFTAKGLALAQKLAAAYPGSVTRCGHEAGQVHLADWTARQFVGSDALVFVGVPFRNHGKLYNVAAVLNRGEIIGLVPKTYLPNYGEFYEQRHFASGLGCLEYVDIEGKRVPFGTDILFICEEEPELVAAAEICEDLWVDTAAKRSPCTGRSESDCESVSQQ